MATDFHDKVSRILHEAVSRRTKERDAFLTREAGNNAAILRSVRNMLPHYLKIHGFKPEPPLGAAWLLPSTTMFERMSESQTPDTEWTPPFSIAPYSVIDVLGRGGMGVVYLGVQAVRRQKVAIKILPSRMLSHQHRRRFQREKELLMRLRHPGIVRVIDSGIANIKDSRPDVESQDRPFFVMEYVEGKPLVRHANKKNLSALDRVELLEKICTAVEFAHRRGVVHRDLKPDNILVDEAGDPKILDFGIAHLQDFGLDGNAEPNQFVGTIAYASPEQLKGAPSALRPTSDVYSLGLLAHELLTNRLPRKRSGKLAIDLRAVQLTDDRDPSSAGSHDFQRALGVVIGTALRRTRGQPCRSAGEMGADWAEIHAAFSARLKTRNTSWG
ncbi:MAG: serine/threonine protein kinase, partial [Planctomycetes bacterium]|nr:serine/threonine protein kinase [Planctomycetota bacterium]